MTQNNSYNDAAASMKVIEMLTVANEYCLFVEKISQFKIIEITLYLSRITPLLYLKGSLLPDLELNDFDANERFVTEEEWLNIYKESKEKLSKINTFYVLDNISDGDAESSKNELSEIISDIYQDLKDFVLLYQKDTMAAKENAVYWCKYLFKNNWGKKCIYMMKCLHTDLYN